MPLLSSWTVSIMLEKKMDIDNVIQSREFNQRHFRVESTNCISSLMLLSSTGNIEPRSAVSRHNT